MEQKESFDLHLDQQSVNIKRGCTLEPFTCIVGFIYCALMVNFGLFLGS